MSFDAASPIPHRPDCGCDACVAPPPQAPHWEAGPTPGLLRRLFQGLAGVDPALARTCPIDEQRQIERVGVAVLFGVMLQALLVFTASVVVLGTDAQALMIAAGIAFVVCGVLFAYDTLFVAADWGAQGAAYAAEQGIAVPGSRPVKRAAAMAVRWGMSAFIASTLAVFVLIRLFGPDIQGRWQEEHRAANAPLAAAAETRHDTLLADLRTRLNRADRQLDTLGIERDALLERRFRNPDMDRQEAELNARLQRAETAAAKAESQEAEHRSSAAAEIAGARLHAGNTGQQGAGPMHRLYRDLADQQAALVRTQAAAATEAKRELDTLRTRRDSLLRDSAEATRAALARHEQSLHAATAARTTLATELRELEDGRTAWIATQIRAGAGYTHPKQGLTASIQTLWTLIEENPGLSALVLGIKISVMLLETAGMLTKAFFTQCRVYALRAALRCSDAGAAEAELRAGWAAWRTRRQDQRDSVTEPLRAARRRREQARRASDLSDRYWEDVLSKRGGPAAA
jgi:hypothetical protein